MKPLPLMLMNLALVVGALFVYDHLREEPPHAGGPQEPASAADWADLERRLAVLEAGRTPSLRAEGSDPRVLERLRALEARAGAAAPTPAVSARSDADEPAGTDPSGTRGQDAAGPAPSDALGMPDAPSPEDIARFRRLREAVAREDRVRQYTERVDRAARKLDLRLSPAQVASIGGAFADFQPRIGEIWTDAKTQAETQMQAGSSVDRARLYTDTRARIQREFVKAIDGVLRGADAEALARGLLLSGK